MKGASSLATAFALLAAPIAVVVVSEGMRDAREPFWRVSTADPTYAYLLNGLSVATGSLPWQIDQPGTPVQALVGASLHVRHTVSSETSPSLVDDVLANPEPYCRFANRVLIGIYALTTLAVGLVARSANAPLAIAVALQATPLLSRTVWDGLLKVGPETLLPTFAAAAALLAFRLSFDDTQSAALVVAAGLVAGLGMATKVTFLTVALMLAVLVVRGRHRVAYVVMAAITAGAAVVATPDRIARFTDFAVQVATHRDLYRPGAAGLPSPQEWIRSVWRFCLADPLLPAVVALCLAMAVSVPRSIPGLRRGLAIAAAAGILHLALAAKDPVAAPRYLVPILGVTGFHGTLLLTSRETLATRRWRGTLAIVVLILVGLRGWRSLYHQQGEAARAKAGAASLSKSLEADPGCLTVPFRGASSLEFALQFGNALSGDHFASALRKRYPDAVSFDVDRQEFVHFGEVIPRADLARARSCLVLRGYTQDGATRANAPLPTDFQLTLSVREGRESLYRLALPGPR